MLILSPQYTDMEKSKLIVVLKTFTKDEIKSFNDFVRSPFFNNETVLIKLADYLQKHHPTYNSPQIEKEKVFAFLYPGKKYNDGLMRNIISDLLRLAEEFLAVTGFQADNIKKGLQLLEELYNRKLWNHFQRQREKTDIEIEKDGFKNGKYFDRKAELTVLYLGFLREEDINFRETHKVLQETSDLMTAGSLVKLLFYNTYMLSVQANIGNISYRLNLADEIESFFENKGKHYLQIPYIEAYYLSYKLFETKDEKYFYKLKDSFQRNFNRINNLDKTEIFSAMKYYAFINEGKTEFIKELFLLYKQEVESGIYNDSDDFIDSGSFMAVVRRGFDAEEFKWTEEFINNHINEVKEDSRKDTLHQCIAAKYYWEKNYDSSLRELAKITSGILQFKLNIKSLTLNIYYDLNETEQFYSHVDTYKHFILKNKLVHERIRGYINNYINYSKRLFDIKNTNVPYKEFELRKLRKEISENQALTEKIWLLKKAEELEH